MTSKYIIFLFVILSTLTFGCSEEKEDTEEAILTGKVTDSRGNPIAGAKIFYQFSLKVTHVANLEKPNPSTTISFTIPKSEPVLVTIHQYYTNKLLAELYSGTPEAGIFSVDPNTDKFKISNGLYILRIKGESFNSEKVLINTIPDFGVLLESTPLIVTDSKGEFSLPVAVLGIGYTENLTNAGGDVVDTKKILETITVVATVPEKPVQTQTITIDTKKSSQVSFQF